MRIWQTRLAVAAVLVPLGVLAQAGVATAQPDAFTPAPGATLTIGGSSRPNALQYSPDGSLIAVGNNGTTTFPQSVSMFSVAADGTTTPVGTTTLPDQISAGSWVGVAFSPSGQFLAVTNRLGNAVYMYRVNPDGTLTGPVFTQSVTEPGEPTFSHDGSLLAFVSVPSTLQVDSVGDDGSLSPFATALAATTDRAGASFSADDSLLAVNATGGTQMYSVGNQALTPIGTPVAGGTPSFSPDGTLLAAGAGDTLYLYSVGSGGSLTGVATETLPSGPDGTGAIQAPGFFGAVWSPDGHLLAVGSASLTADVQSAVRQIPIYSVGADGTLTQVPGSPFAVGNDAKHIAWRPDGRCLAYTNTGDGDGSACLRSTNALVISKSADKSSVVPGRDTLTYTVTIQNPGVDQLSGPVVDDLSSVLSHARYRNDAAADVGSVSFDPAADQLTWDGTLDPGQTATVTYSVRVHPGASGELHNSVVGPDGSACAGQTQTEPPCTLDTPIAPPQADVSIEKSVSPSSVHAGDQVTYTLVVRNHGPSDATHVRVRDVAAGAERVDSISTPRGTCRVLLQTGVRCLLGTLRRHRTIRIVVTATVLSDSASSIPDRAVVSTRSIDSNPANNRSGALVTVIPNPPPPTSGPNPPPPDADLAITKTAEPGTAAPGSQLIWTITVTDNGPDPATGVTIHDLLPVGVSAEPPLPSQGTCTTTTGAFECHLGHIQVGDTVVIHVVSTVSGNANSTVTNIAAVHADQHDPNTANNLSNAVVDVTPVADLSLTKTGSKVGEVRIGTDQASAPSSVAASRTVVVRGNQVIYTLTIFNSGPDDATGVRVSDPAVAGVLFVSAQTSQGSCSVAVNGSVACQLGDLPVNGRATVQIIAQVAANAQLGAIRNVASVSSDQFDPNDANNLGTSTIDEVLPAPLPPPRRPAIVPGTEPVSDLVVSKHADPHSARIGQPVHYTITLTNRGPDPAPVTRLLDTFDRSITLGDVRASRGTCTHTRPVTCSLGTVPVHGRVTVRITATSHRGGRLVNAASATSRNWDPRPANNIARAHVNIRLALQISIRTPRARFTAGERTAVIVLVRNPNPVGLHHVVTCVAFPSGLAFHGSIPHAVIKHGLPCFELPALRARGAGAYTLHAASVCVPTGARLTTGANAIATDTDRVRTHLRIRRLGGNCRPAVTG